MLHPRRMRGCLWESIHHSPTYGMMMYDDRANVALLWAGQKTVKTNHQFSFFLVVSNYFIPSHRIARKPRGLHHITFVKDRNPQRKWVPTKVCFFAASEDNKRRTGYHEKKQKKNRGEFKQKKRRVGATKGNRKCIAHGAIRTQNQ